MFARLETVLNYLQANLCACHWLTVLTGGPMDSGRKSGGMYRAWYRLYRVYLRHCISLDHTCIVTEEGRAAVERLLKIANLRPVY